jgi:MbtH protein
VSEPNDAATYKVVVNDEEQYSIWPVDKDNALGWKDAGKSGTREECLAHIKEVWTDMRPLSLRRQPGQQDAGEPQGRGPADSSAVD